MNQELFEKIKKVSSDDAFYDHNNYMEFDLGTHRLSLLLGLEDNIEILLDPPSTNENIPTHTTIEHVIPTVEQLIAILVEEAAKNSMAPIEYEGFDAEEEVEYTGMPDIDRDKGRELLIYSWGKRHHKSAPKDSKLNINAGLLSGKKEGLDLKNINGTDSKLQARIVRAKMFYPMLMRTIEKIEKENLNVVSVNCTAGRHRSVAFAEILKNYYYPNAVINHLDI